MKQKSKEIFSFIYKESFANGLTEYEYDHVFFGEYSKDPVLNPDEACDFKWISIFELKSDIEQNPSSYTAWLKIILINILNILSLMKITICRKSHFNSAHKLYNKTWSKEKNLKVFWKM